LNLTVTLKIAVAKEFEFKYFAFDRYRNDYISRNLKFGRALNTANMLRAHLHAKPKGPKPQLPSLVSQHGRDLDWRKYDRQTIEFNEHMTRPFNPDREGPPHQDDSGGNLQKINSVTANVLTHLKVHHGWRGPMTYEWLLEGGHFDEIFTSYATRSKDDRGNLDSYVAKQLQDLAHPVRWAGHREWAWGVMPTRAVDAILGKLSNLRADYAHTSGKQAGSRKRARELQAPAQERCDLQGFRGMVDEWEATLTESVADKDDADWSDSSKLEVADCLMCKLGCRGGRGVDLHQLYMAWTRQTTSEWLESGELEDGACVLVGHRDSEDGWELLVNTKGHFVDVVLSDASRLLDLYHRCFPWLEEGDIYFSPCMHGTRVTKSRVEGYFEDSAKFADYFGIVTKRQLGMALRPYDVRRMNSRNLQAINASSEVKKSHSVLMGTGVPNLEGTYDDRSTTEKGFLASQVQRYQFSPLFTPRYHNRMAPALLSGTEGVSIVPARLVRREAHGVDLFALFATTDERHWELSTRFIRTKEDLPTASMTVDAGNSPSLLPSPSLPSLSLLPSPSLPSLSLLPSPSLPSLSLPSPSLPSLSGNGRQLCRSKGAAIDRCHRHFSEQGANEFEFAVSSMVHGSVEPAPNDIVYLPNECIIAEVKAIDEDGKMQLVLATELLDSPHRTSMQTFFRFTHDSRVSEAGLSDVLFPLDLCFNASDGHFILRKSSQMETV
jgi:hypothetical protein